MTFDQVTQTWLAVGPSGSDVSRDDGNTWKPLKPGPGDAAETAGNWNAIALPYVVGPKGRIGKLRVDTLRP